MTRRTLRFKILAARGLCFVLALTFLSQAEAAVVVQVAEAPFVCARVTAPPLPKSLRLTAEDKIKLRGCTSAGDYYGLSEGRSNFERARKCALLEREQGWRVGSLSPGLLMMMFANAQGVKRDYDLASRFVCEARLEPGETSTWIRELAKEKSAVNKNQLDYCDRIGRGPAELSCVLVRKQQQAVLRAKKFKELAENFNAVEKQKIAKVLELAARFFALDTAWRNAGHLSGEARSSFMNGHEAYAWDQLEIWIVRLERQKRIRLSADLLVEIDSRLNKRYRELKASLPEADRLAFQKAQRTWIDYRDALVDFASSRYAPHDSSVWLAELTRRRIEEMAF